MRLGFVLLAGLIAAMALGACECGERRASVTAKGPTSQPGTFRTLRPLPREEGPARKETPAQIAAAEKEARSFTRQMLSGRISRREVTAMADIRGYRLYRRRYFAQAHTWFEAAIRVDPSYELSLFNAARTAALIGRLKRARSHLESLRRLETPLARSRLARVARDPDFGSLRRASSSQPAKPLR